MLFINKRTRVVIDSPTFISGGDWVLKDEEETAVKEATATEVEPIVETSEVEEVAAPASAPGIDDMTKADIMQELDAFGIKYDKKQTKAELYELMMNGK